jgi:hypothetical protein
VRADEKLTVFIELELAMCACGELPLLSGMIFSRLGVTTTDSNQAEDIVPAGFFASSGPAIPKNQRSGEKERKNYESH